jgi:peptide/nickel transport system permease protein
MDSDFGSSNLRLRRARSGSYASRVVRRFGKHRLAVVSLVVLVVLYAFAVLGPFFSGSDSEAVDLGNQLAGISWAHPLGTDESGRDVMIRLMLGGRVSLAVGTFAVLFSLVVGVSVGGLAGFFLGWVDTLLMRFTDGVLAIPAFFVVLCALTFFGSSLPNIILVIGLTSWMGLARLVRGEILSVRQEVYVEAVRALGAQNRVILLRHVLPQVIPTMIVNGTLGVANAILAESALSFLGVGVQPPAASWGNMLSGAQNYLYNAPWLAIYPGMLILLTVLAFNLIGDGLRDATDPTLQ